MQTTERTVTHSGGLASLADRLSKPGSLLTPVRVQRFTPGVPRSGMSAAAPVDLPIGTTREEAEELGVPMERPSDDLHPGNWVWDAWGRAAEAFEDSEFMRPLVVAHLRAAAEFGPADARLVQLYWMSSRWADLCEATDCESLVALAREAMGFWSDDDLAYAVDQQFQAHRLRTPGRPLEAVRAADVFPADEIMRAAAIPAAGAAALDSARVFLQGRNRMGVVA